MVLFSVLMRTPRHMALVVGVTNFFWLIVRPSWLRMSERAKKELQLGATAGVPNQIKSSE